MLRSIPTLRLLVFANRGAIIPDTLLDQITAIDRDAPIKRKWISVISELEKNSFEVHDVIIDICEDVRRAASRIGDIWELRVQANYAIRPAYLVIGKTNDPVARFEVVNRGGHFLRLADVPTHFFEELEQIRLGFDPLARSLPRWQVVREGAGPTARASVFLLTRSRPRVRGGDLCSAVLAVLLKNNRKPRSFCEIRKLLEEDPLFQPAGGSFEVPSIASLKMYLHRGFPGYLQEAFEYDRSGYSADWVIDREELDGKTVGYRIRGVCE